ncbi:MAG: MFS transporter [Acidobacteria bacterium RIFCSPLOWO2_02_FULL_68_18]|nr:MAG: MFS transporter [Acidobacteria bacterium RIFCSPLOWO2_02_FULL_68_18]OFW51382.1 MAG: MFS transporter [Acidobacteria bacterium RIFCSPLOWO2_12_FULL_68_19]
MTGSPTIDRDLSQALDSAERRRQLVRAVAASAAGTTIEWYDFFLYGVAAATVFPQKFFPGSDPFIGTLLSFSTFFVGFVARPMGAALFGHFGDRAGRKALLIITMMMMGIATVGIGLIPSYETVGVWGAVLLVVGRILQGLSVGGEWSGSVLMAGEWADPKHRGFTTSFAQFGAPAGMVLANGALALMTLTTTDAQFVEWGWRIPFLASIVLVFVGLYIRIGVLETPVFSRLKARGAVQKAPLVEVVRRNWREIVLTALLRTGQQVQFYIFTTYIITYATQQLGMSRGTILNFVMLQALLSLVTVVYMGHLSDRFGRRRVTAIGCAIMLVYPFVYFGLLDTRSMALVFLAVLVALPLHDLQYGPQAAFISESFPGSLRYSGSSLGYQLASITAGGPAPLIAVLLYQQFGTSTAVAVYMAICSLISLVCVFALQDRAGTLDQH